MSRGELGCMTTPAQGNRVPPGCRIGADNGKFGKSWKGAAHWWAWLAKTVERYGAERFLFAVAPDVPFDAAATLAESRPWLPKIRTLGVPAAFAAQNGSEAPGLIPWDELDVLFIGGDDDWKDGPHPRRLIREARLRGKKSHVGRTNTKGRLDESHRRGADSVDGTTLAFGARKNLPPLQQWLKPYAAQGVQEWII
jgi:hypothetical protein